MFEAKISEIREWKKNDFGWLVNPENDARIMLGNWVRLGDGVRLGDEVTLGDGVRLGNKVTLGNWVRLGDGVRLGDRFLTIQDIYICHIYPTKESVSIRIGCEIHTVEEWEREQWNLADKYKDEDNNWYEKTGQYIYQLLKGEAERYGQS